MSEITERPFRRLAVIGAGNMGSGIAQKIATEGFPVVLVDVDDEKVARGLGILEKTLAEGVERRIFKPDQAKEIRSRVDGTADWSRLGDCDLVVEAVFEDLAVKRDVFRRLDEVCRPDAILGTNTSSLAVTDLASATRHPERVRGAALLLPSCEEPAGGGRPRQGDRPGRGAARVGSSRADRQDADRLAGSRRVRGESVLRPVAQRGRALPRGGRRRHPDHRGRIEGSLRNRNGARSS